MGSLDFWFTLAVVILFFQLFTVLLVVLLLTAGTSYGLRMGRLALKDYVPTGQRYLEQGNQLVRQYAHKVTAPIVQLNSATEQLGATVKTFFARLK